MKLTERQRDIVDRQVRQKRKRAFHQKNERSEGNVWNGDKIRQPKRLWIYPGR